LFALFFDPFASGCDTETDGPSCPPGQEGCACDDTGACQKGLTCVSDECVVVDDPKEPDAGSDTGPLEGASGSGGTDGVTGSGGTGGEDGVAGGEGSDGTGGVDGSSGVGGTGGAEPSCAEGTEGCACYRNGLCNLGLGCVAGVCVEPSGTGGFGGGNPGGDPCADTSTCGGCGACARLNECESEATACALNTECVVLEICLSNCADQSCTDNCMNEHPQGVTDMFNLSKCVVCRACFAECAPDPFTCR
jgi:hypothetical protein